MIVERPNRIMNAGGDGVGGILIGGSQTVELVANVKIVGRKDSEVDLRFIWQEWE